MQEFAAFKWCDDAVLEWPRRRDDARLIKRDRGYDRIRASCKNQSPRPDTNLTLRVVCLQEVEFETQGQRATNALVMCLPHGSLTLCRAYCAIEIAAQQLGTTF